MLSKQALSTLFRFGDSWIGISECFEQSNLLHSLRTTSSYGGVQLKDSQEKKYTGEKD